MLPWEMPRSWEMLQHPPDHLPRSWEAFRHLPVPLVAKRACTADITILGVVANEDDDHHDAKDDDNDARGALITEERCVKAIVLDPHGREAWGAAILLLDTVAPLHRQRRGRASSPRRSLSRAMTRLKDTYRSY